MTVTTGRAKQNPLTATFSSVVPIALEPRFMFDAAGAATAADAATDAQAEAEAEQAHSSDSGNEADNHEVADIPAGTGADSGTRREIMVVDTSVAGWQDLISDLAPGTETILLDGTKGGIAQLAQMLAGKTGIDALHILSHGDTGMIKLGTDTLTTDTLARYADALSVISASLGEQGDILLYGCLVGEGGEGQAFVDALANLTGADIAASDDLTGAENLGGDWDLEITTGDIDATTPLSSVAMNNFVGVLANVTFDFEGGSVVGDKVHQTSGAYTIVVDGKDTNINLGYYSYTSTPVDGSYQPSAWETEITISLSDNQTFNIASLDIFNMRDDQPQSFTFTSNEGDILTLDVTSDLSFSTINFTDFTGISTLTITSSQHSGQFAINLDNIVFNNIATAPSNDAPTLTGTPGDATTNEDTATTIDLSAYTVADADGDEIELTLHVDSGTIASTDDNGTSENIVVAGSGTGSMTLTGTAGDLNTYLTDRSKIVYTPAANATGSATLTVTPSDGKANGTGTADTVTINITAVNDAPTVTASGGTTDYTEGVAIAVDGGLTLSDVDSATLASATVSITTGFDTGSDVLAFTNDGSTMGNIAASYNASTGVLTLTSAGATATVAQWQAALRAITYDSTNDAVTGERTVSFVVNDGSADSTAPTKTVSIAHYVNDAPTITNGGTSLLTTTNEDTTSAAKSVSDILTDVSYSDPESGASTGIAITGVTGNGRWEYSTDDGTSWHDVGSVSAGEALLLEPDEQLRYVPDSRNGETATLSFRAWDQATGSATNGASRGTADTTTNGGSTAFSSQTASVSITVSDVNDVPTVPNGGTTVVTVTEDTASNFDLSAVTLADVDGDNLTVTIVVSAGTFLSPASGVGVGSGVTATLENSTTIKLVGSAADINAYLDTASNIQYTGASHASGTAAATYTVHVDDGTVNPKLVDSTINITAVNDAPTITGLDGNSATFTEDGSAVLLDVGSDAVVADVDNANFNGGSLTVAIASGGDVTEDLLGISTSGVVTLDDVTAGANVRVNGNVIGTLDNAISAGNNLVISFTTDDATLANVQALVRALTYSNTDTGNPTNTDRTVRITLNDGETNSANYDVTVGITRVNDNPTGSGAPTDVTVTEDTASNLDLSAITLTDVDGETITLTLAAGAGTMTATSGNNVTIGGSGTGTLTLQGTAADINSFLDTASNIQFTGAENVNGNDVTTIIATVNDGHGGGNIAVGTINVDITAINDAPVVGGVNGDSSAITAGNGAQNVSLFDDVTITNVDSTDYNGGKITIVQNSGTTNGSWGLENTTVAYSGGDDIIAGGEAITINGVTIGTVSNTNTGQGGNSLEITLNANATSANIQTLLSNLTFDAASGLGARTFTLTVNDGDGTANGGVEAGTADFTVNVQPNPPVISNLSGDTVSANNGQTVSFDLGGNVTVTDSDSANFNGGALTITRTGSLSGNFSLSGTGSTGVSAGTSTGAADGTIAAGETIYVDGVAIATVSGTDTGQGTNNLVLTFGSEATPAKVQTLLRALQYSSTSGGAHTFSLTISDASANAGTSTAATTTINVAHAPVNTVPGAQSGTDGTSKALTGISVADTDSSNVTTTVSVGSGLGTFSTTASGSASITGGGSNSIQISGTLADVNATLANLQYTPAINASGSHTITVLSSDGTNTDSDTITVAVNDRPDIGNLNGDAVTFTENSGAVVLDSGSDATITDNNNPADLNGGSVVVSMTGGVGSNDILAAVGSVTFSDSIAGSNVMVSGVTIGTLANALSAGNELRVNFNEEATVARVTTLLRSLSYNNLSDAPTAGTKTITITLTDNDGGTSTQSSVTLTKVAVNDAPTATGVPASVTVTEDTASNVDLSAITITDKDSGSGSITVTITASAGTLTATNSGGVTVGGSASALTLTGTVANIDAYLNTASNIKYTSATNASGDNVATLTIKANDGGNTGTGGGSDVTLGTV
ncbi:DUF4347 domain-containing protein, partial [Thalassospira profundimaris]